MKFRVAWFSAICNRCCESVVALWILLAGGLFADAAKPGAAGLEFFEAKIRPVLVKHCYECHSAKLESPKGGLVVDSRDGMLTGGDSGPALVPGKAAESLLLSALKHELLEMPPRGRLPQGVIDDFARWVDMGAPDPRDGQSAARRDGIDLEKGREFWAFRPPVKRVPPALENPAWPESDVDRFILARLEAEGLAPVAAASRRTLVRRLYFDLTGLPPTPEESAAFLADRSDDAVAALVDRLLDSPYFGERWGRHWLDVARYADSTGGGRTRALEDAWRYRDYVIASFNRDKPFDRFVAEQVAGDLLPYDSPEQRREQLIASGFLVLGPNNYENQDKDLLRMEVVEEQINVVGRAILAMTLGCARCHDHKFDPIPTEDYYALAGIFRSTKSLTPGNVSGFVERPLPLPPEQQAALAAAQQQMEQAKQAVANQKGLLAKLEGQLRQLSPADPFAGTVVDDRQAEVVGQWQTSTYNPDFVGAGYLHDANAGKGDKLVRFPIQVDRSGEYEVQFASPPGSNRAANVPVQVESAGGTVTVRVNQQQAQPIDRLFVALGRFRFQRDTPGYVTVSNRGTSGHVIADGIRFTRVDKPPQEQQLDPAAAQREEVREARRREIKEKLAAEKERLKQLEAQLAQRAKQAPPRPQCMAVQDETNPADWHVHIRGEIRNLGQKVPRGYLQVAAADARPPIADQESGRRELAAWLASPNNPLTARVWVNRVWHHLFGAGLVRTTDNFGHMGERPSHPELLDYLTVQFIDDNWSTKRLIRRLVLSRVYALSTEADAQTATADPENRLLSRMNRRRLDAESLRDAMLQASGELDLTAGGPSVRPENRGSGKLEYGYRYTTLRRSVYVPVFRNSLYELFEVFDFADPNRTVGRRTVSTLPTQALFLMNNPFILERSRQFAERLLALERTDGERLTEAYLCTLGRPPTDTERQLALNYLDAPPEKASQQEQARQDDRAGRWAVICQGIFASLDFRFLD